MSIKTPVLESDTCVYIACRYVMKNRARLISMVFRLMYELLALCSYVGALIAIRRGYTDLVPALFRHTRCVCVCVCVCVYACMCVFV